MLVCDAMTLYYTQARCLKENKNIYQRSRNYNWEDVTDYNS